MRYGTLKYLWLLLLPIAALEIYSGWNVQINSPSDDDWTEVNDSVRKIKRPGDLVVYSPEWVSPLARMHLKSVMPLKDYARFDTTLYKRIIEVSADGSQAKETKNLKIKKEFEVGNITVRVYEKDKWDSVLYDFVKNLNKAKITGTPRKSPRLVTDHFFFPRLVIPVSLGRTSELIFPSVPLKGVIRGYGIIGYKSGRYDKGDPVIIRVTVDGKEVGHTKIKNIESVKPFVFKLPNIPGLSKGTVKFLIHTKNNRRREFGFAADVRIPGS